jgi:hydroxyacylglutathione hydrolase
VRLTERIYLVGGAEPGWPISDALDAQVYVVDTSDGLAAIDAGAGRATASLVAAIQADGLDPSGVRWLLLTHAHADHAGGAAAWRRVLPHVEVLASADVAGWLVRGDEEATSVDRARGAGIYPAGYRLEPCEVDPLPDHSIRLGDLVVDVIPTPGHAAGHLAFSVRIDGATTLFSGDALFPEGRILLQDTWDCDLGLSLRSVERLAAVAPERLLAGHREPVLTGAIAHVEHAIDRIRRLLPPESLE